MAESIGVDGIHCVSGTCDLCGDVCDANTQELNVLSCTFKNCQDLPYHQDCLEKYLKSIRLERNRKTGFKCPRGCGKGSAHKDPCPGKIDKSHPIHPRNEEQKKKKKSKLPEVLAVPAARPAKIKEDKKQDKAAAPKATAASPAADKGKAAKAIVGAAKPVAAASSSSNAIKARPPPQPDPKAQLAAAVAAARRELAAATGSKSRDSTPPHPPAPAAPEYKTLDMYYRENAVSSSNLSSMSSSAAAAAAPVTNAWASKPPPVPAAPSALAAAASRLALKTAADQGRLQPAHSSHSVHSAQSSHLSSRAESPTAQLIPPPPPPPPPPQQQQQQQQQPALPVGGASSSSTALQHAALLQQQGSSLSLQSSSSLAASGQLPVGMEYADDEQPHLTKAQRKNLKRAEKKKKGSQADMGSSAATGSDSQGAQLAASNGIAAHVGSSSMNAAASSSNATAAAGRRSRGSAGPASSAAAATAADEDDDEATSLMYELAVQALLANKTLALVVSLQRLGFSEWQAAAAVQRHGSDLEEAVAWLLDGGAPTPEAAASVSSGCVAEVNIHQELSLMESLAAAMPQISRSKLYQTVADAGGDLDAAAAVCLQQAAAAEETAAAAVDASDSAAAGMASQTDYSSNLFSGDTLSLSQQRLGGASGANVLDSSSGFAAAPSLYSAASAAQLNAGGSSQLSGSESMPYVGWLGESSITSLGSSQQYHQQQQQQQQLGSSSILCGLRSSSPLAGAGAATSGSLGFLQTAATAGLGSSIWANSTDQQTAGNSSNTSMWATGPASGSGSLFGSTTGTAVGGFGSGSLGLGAGASGLGLLQQQQPQVQLQQSLSTEDPVLDVFSNSTASAFSSSAAGNEVSSVGLQGTGQQWNAPSIQQSRLFQSYVPEWRQQPLFGSTEEQPQQRQQQQVPAEDEQDHGIEDLMATLMCH